MTPSVNDAIKLAEIFSPHLHSPSKNCKFDFMHHSSATSHKLEDSWRALFRTAEWPQKWTKKRLFFAAQIIVIRRGWMKQLTRASAHRLLCIIKMPSPLFASSIALCKMLSFHSQHPHLLPPLSSWPAEGFKHYKHSRSPSHAQSK